MKIPSDWLDAAQTFVIGLTPGALGSAVGLAHEKGLSWAERFTQLAAGTVMSWFVTRALGSTVDLNPFVLQGIGFTAGMIAYKSTPRFIAAAADVAGGLPAAIRDRFLPARKDPK
ncbi:hypothetical protein CA235_17575 [Sphingomonas sp. ABOLF]|uniref:hypothetical protein n=1 Tax=Sphingomonas sp. ABOLF TaxID=1985879 RepID=UPI000F7F08F8|nr:hypothetical protein [Sphingomonas sp. ABOLF]RSV12285.1 hypothetical protein CA235_17575 [Sphingomonas sp. ABOLF]